MGPLPLYMLNFQTFSHQIETLLPCSGCTLCAMLSGRSKFWQIFIVACMIITKLLAKSIPH